MELAPSPEQRLLVESARAYFARSCPIERVRAMEADERGFAAERWREMAALGWNGLALPAAEGGGGQTFLDLVLLLEEAGRVLLPEPLLATAAVAAPLLLACDEGEERRRCLGATPPATGGHAGRTNPVVAREWQAPASQRAATAMHRSDDSASSIAPHADVVLVAARLAEEGACLLAVPHGTPGTDFRRQRVLGLEPSYEMRFAGARLAPHGLISRGDGAVRAIESGLLHAATATLAFLAGAAARVLE